MGHQTAVLDEVMEIESPQEHTAEAAILSGVPEARSADLPTWFRQRQGEAWSRFVSLPMPNRKEQAWRFSNVSALDLAPFSLGGLPDERAQREILERSQSLAEVAGRLVFADDHLLRRDPLPENLRKLGVILK